MKYVVLKQFAAENEPVKKNLERITDERWNIVQNYIQKDRIIYITDNPEDENLKEFTEITWERYYNRLNKQDCRLIINFIPDNIPQMEELAKQKLEEKQNEIEETIRINHENRIKKHIQRKSTPEYKEQLRRHHMQVDQMDLLIPMDMEEYEALMEWKNLDYITPPPRRIKQIKDSYENKTWKEFIQIIENM